MTAPALMPSQDVDQQQWQQLAANDPDYSLWHDQRQAEDDAAFEAWLDTPEGMAWLDSEAEAHLESRGLSHWNHDGFSPVIYA